MYRKIAIVSVAFACLSIVGCSNRDAAKPKADKEKKAVHNHPDKGPHGGALVEWGDDDYHLEFLVDHGKKEATVYVLDDVAAKPAPIAAEEITLTLTHTKPPLRIPMKAAPETGDAKGKSSRFVAVHDELGKEMDFKGEISGKVGDTPYRGDLEEKDHDHKKK